jgi:hypothetical protein
MSLQSKTLLSALLRGANKVCVLFQMATLTHKRPPKLNRNEPIRPAMTGSVGVPLVANQLAHCYPGQDIRYDPAFERKGLGSDLTRQPIVYDSNWNMGRGEVNAYGMMQQDLRVPDLLHAPTLGGLPQYTYRNQIATLYNAKRTGFNFLPLPGPYEVSPGEMVRGGQVVRTTDIEGIYSVVENNPQASGIKYSMDRNTPFQQLQDRLKQAGSLSQGLVQESSGNPGSTIGRAPKGRAPNISPAMR